MAIAKRTEIGSIEVLPKGQIQVRTDTIIEEDGVQLGKSYHRHVLEPGSDISQQDQRVKDVAVIVHTDECKAAWIEFIKNSEIKLAKH
jgi:hypothetical protein